MKYVRLFCTCLLTLHMLKTYCQICLNHKCKLILHSNLITQSLETKTERQKLNRIKAVLAETGHTGKWLAKQLGKAPVTVSKWCTNTSQPDLYTLRHLSELLNVGMSLYKCRPINCFDRFNHDKINKQNKNNLRFWCECGSSSSNYCVGK